MTTQIKVYNVIILDKSGSMGSIARQAIDGVNETIGSIKSAQEKNPEQTHMVTLVAFCGCELKAIYDNVPVAQVQPLSDQDYHPCCMTPLYDAIGATITRVHAIKSHDNDSLALVTIITDGYENSSKEWTGPAIKALIDGCKEEGWMFSFIGAGEDVVKVATTISITNTVVWEQTAEGTKEMFDNENDAQSRFYDKMAAPCCASASVADRKRMRKRFSEEYYDKDKR